MPLYEYECMTHGVFHALRPMAEYQSPQACPCCGEQATRVVATAINLSHVTATNRKAHERNERSAHAPASSRDKKHGAGCSCCSDARQPGKTVTAADGAKTFPSQRPWMISQ
jgi:putative FmdB family regulatory protein